MREMKTYKSGLRLVVEPCTNNESVSFNMLVKVGSVNEDDKTRGISHFVEHMLFKSTEHRSSLELNKAFDKIGVSANAFTDITDTVYSVKCLKQHLPTCIELFSDMLFFHKFDKAEFEKERKVILEEYTSYQYDISQIAVRLMMKELFKGTNYSHPIIGYEETIKKITHKDLINYFKEHYTPNNIILSFAGNITMEDAKNLTETYFQSNFKSISLPSYEKKDIKQMMEITPKFSTYYNSEIQQSGVYISFPACNNHNKNKYAVRLLMAALGDGMSSPLFTKVREERGLVYDIGTHTNNYNVGGYALITFFTTSKNVGKIVVLIRDLLKEIKENGITEDLLQIAKTSIITDYIFSCETNEEIAENNARYLAKYDQLDDRKEQIANINAVTLDEVNELAKQMFTKKNIVISYVGKNLNKNLLNLFLPETIDKKQENKVEEVEQEAIM